MSTVEDLLSQYIAEHRAAGDADPAVYLAKVTGIDRAELAAHIDRYLTEAPRPSFDADAFARFRGDPRRQAMVERILDDATLEDVRKQAGISKTRAGEALARSLGLAGREQRVKARYHDIETGNVDPSRVRPRVWEALAAILGASAERLRSAAESAFGAAGARAEASAFTRLGGTAEVFASLAEPSAEEDAVDRAMFED